MLQYIDTHRHGKTGHRQRACKLRARPPDAQRRACSMFRGLNTPARTWRSTHSGVLVSLVPPCPTARPCHGLCSMASAGQRVARPTPWPARCSAAERSRPPREASVIITTAGRILLPNSRAKAMYRSSADALQRCCCAYWQLCPSPPSGHGSDSVACRKLSCHSRPWFAARSSESGKHNGRFDA